MSLKMIFLILIRSIKQIISSISKHLILTLQSISLDHLFLYLISFLISISLSSKMKRNIINNIIFEFIIIILNILSIYILKLIKRIISFKFLFSIKTNFQYIIFTSSHILF